MTRKDYILIAESIRNMNISMVDKLLVICSMGEMLEKENPKFDFHKFHNACLGISNKAGEPKRKEA
jgi:hypothetical protein